MTATTTTDTGWNRHGGLVALAVGYQWFYNGANFLAFKVAGGVLHPLMVAALRFSIAGLILLGGAQMIDREAPDAHNSTSAQQGERSVRAPHVPAPSEFDRSIWP